MKKNTNPAAPSTQPDAPTRRQAVTALTSSLGLLLIAAATVMPIIAGAFPRNPLYKWLYCAGAVIVLLSTLFNPAPKAWPLRRRRWHRIEGWSAIFFAVAAAFLWIPGSAPRDWLAFTLAGAIIRIICFFRSFKPY